MTRAFLISGVQKGSTKSTPISNKLGCPSPMQPILDSSEGTLRNSGSSMATDTMPIGRLTLMKVLRSCWSGGKQRKRAILYSQAMSMGSFRRQGFQRIRLSSAMAVSSIFSATSAGPYRKGGMRILNWILLINLKLNQNQCAIPVKGVFGPTF